MQRSIVYLFAARLDHPGLKIKAQGQLKALATRYHVRLREYLSKKEDPFWKALGAYFSFHLKSFADMVSYDGIYSRYNAKFPLLFLGLIVTSFFKPVYIEHNGFYGVELKRLRRYPEWMVHSFLFWAFKFSRCHHLAVHTSLVDIMIRSGYKKEYVSFMQNGYSPPPISDHANNLNSIRNLQSKFKRTALFVSSAQAWCGLDILVEMIRPYPDLLVVVVGPFDPEATVSPQLLYLGTLEPPVIASISALCDFGIGHLNWQEIGGHEGAPLKTREYLCNGLPILVNYYDHASDIPELGPYVFNLQVDVNALGAIYSSDFDHEKIRRLANQYLSWEAVLLPLIKV